MMSEARIVLSMATLLWVPCAIAQATLGALLDKGAKPLSAAQFKDEVVQRMTVGPTPTGGTLELMYAQNGTVHGRGTAEFSASSPIAPSPGVSGEWKIDSMDRICTTMRIAGWTSGSTVLLPTRCQYWFKLGDQYYFADSDTDRSAKVLSRTLKR